MTMLSGCSYFRNIISVVLVAMLLGGEFLYLFMLIFDNVTLEILQLNININIIWNTLSDEKKNIYI